MLCEKCKIREANVLLTEMSNGEVRTHHYCMKCASSLNIPNNPLLEDFPIAKMLAGLLSMQTSADEDMTEYMDIECPTCHTKYSDVASGSKFGCPDCYEVFDLLINDTIKQLQGSDQHRGKHPADMRADQLEDTVKTDIARDTEPVEMSTEKTEKLMELKRLLRVALANEEYEEAAAYRDQIHALEDQTPDSEGKTAGSKMKKRTSRKKKDTGKEKNAAKGESTAKKEGAAKKVKAAKSGDAACKDNAIQKTDAAKGKNAAQKKNTAQGKDAAKRKAAGKRTGNKDA